jgi:hypothetical protein
MRNLILLNLKELQLETKDKILEIYIDELSKLIVLLSSQNIIVYSYDKVDFMSNFSFTPENITKKIPLNKNITKILDSNVKIKLFIYKIEEETFHIMLDSGEYIRNKSFSHQQQDCDKLNDLDEDRGIVSVKISPNLEHIVVVYDNYTILLLNYEFDVLNRVELDDGEGTKNLSTELLESADISFKGDGEFFIVSYLIGDGVKTLTRDMKLNIIKGPAKADNKVVFSTAEGVNKGKHCTININFILLIFFNTNNNKYLFFGFIF